MHKYSSQIFPHLSESEETSTDEESFSSKSYSSSSNSEKSFTNISKLLMVQPSTGSNDPSPSSPPQTPIVEEAYSDTNPPPHQENSSSKLSNGHGLLLMIFQKKNGQPDFKNFLPGLMFKYLELEQQSKQSLKSSVFILRDL